MSKVRKYLASMAAVALALAGVTACNDDDSDDEALPRSEFVERANALCAEADGQGSEAFESVSFADPANPSDEELQELAGALLPSLRDHRQDLAELGPPEGAEQEFENLLDALDRTIDRVDEASDDSSAASELADPNFFADIASAEETLGICPQEE